MDMNKATVTFLLIMACAFPAFGQSVTQEAVYKFLSPYFERPLELSLRPDYKVEYDLKKDRFQVKLTKENHEVPSMLRQFDPTFSVQSWKVYTLSFSISNEPLRLLSQFPKSLK